MHQSPDLRASEGNNIGCIKCDSCTLCDNFLLEGETVTSPRTNQTFKIKTKLTCKTKNVIYIIFDKICKTVFYIGYTCDCMQVRWRNHKSHIKKCIKSCELSKHFAEHCSSTHKFNTTDQAIFTEELSKHLGVMIIESVESIPGIDMKPIMEARETYWQGALKATKLFGGINVRKNIVKK